MAGSVRCLFPNASLIDCYLMASASHRDGAGQPSYSGTDDGDPHDGFTVSTMVTVAGSRPCPKRSRLGISTVHTRRRNHGSYPTEESWLAEILTRPGGLRRVRATRTRHPGANCVGHSDVMTLSDRARERVTARSLTPANLQAWRRFRPARGSAGRGVRHQTAPARRRPWARARPPARQRAEPPVPRAGHPPTGKSE